MNSNTSSALLERDRKAKVTKLTELEFQRLKTAIHEELVESLDLSMVGELDEELLAQEMRRLGEEICLERGKSLSADEQRRMIQELMDEIFGLGPLEGLMRDPTVSDILVNGPHEVFVERRGRLERADVVFADERHVMRIIQRVVARVGRRIDEVSPMVDARLPDGSRVNAIIPPLGAGRAEAFHPPLRHQAAGRRRTCWPAAPPGRKWCSFSRRRSARGSAS